MHCLKKHLIPHTKFKLQIPAIMRLLLLVLGMAYAGYSIFCELEYVGSDLFSSICLLFKSLHKIKRLVHFLAKGQKIG